MFCSCCISGIIYFWVYFFQEIWEFICVYFSETETWNRIGWKLFPFFFLFTWRVHNNFIKLFLAVCHTLKKRWALGMFPPASPVYVLKGPHLHSLPCVHPASRPNEPCVYLPPAAGKRGGVVTNQSRADRGKLSSVKHGEAGWVLLFGFVLDI